MQITCPTHPTPGDMGAGNRNKVFFLPFLDQIFLQPLDSFHEMLVKSPLTPLFLSKDRKRIPKRGREEAISQMNIGVTFSIVNPSAPQHEGQGLPYKKIIAVSLNSF